MSSERKYVTGPNHDEVLGCATRALLVSRGELGPDDILGIVETVRTLVSADRVQLHVADYALNCARVLVPSGELGNTYVLEGTLAGRAFTTGEPVLAGATWWLPLVDGAERLGVIELEYTATPPTSDELLKLLTALLVLVIISVRRYTDVWLRSRRAQPLSAAAEAQWDLLPPLATISSEVAVSGILEPAYEIGGDSFDYALNPGRLDFAIVDAIGHGLSAVLMSIAVINSLRNTRRERGTFEGAYRQADEIIERHFGNSNYVTGQFGSLDLSSGLLTWVNAGHLLPMLVRNGSYVGELKCAPSMPLGLSGPVVEIAQETLQRGDRVLFYTDGISESRSPNGGRFGQERLADFLVRATLDGLPGAETVRRLSAAVGTHVGKGLNDDATMLLVEYRPQTSTTLRSGTTDEV
ncbi:MAG: serine/threonine-protein phosphatase [Ilumatobacteraceae bacterium]|nr:serine/threonine-protein phosphatase [Ilumatobacteraceae bacterium]